MKASLYYCSKLEILWIGVQLIISAMLQSTSELITVVPFIVTMLLVQQLNKQGFVVGAVQGLVQAYYAASLPQSIQNLLFGVSCAVQFTRNYIPKNLQGDGWLFLFGYMCYVFLGVWTLGLYLQQNNIHQESLDLYYLGVIQVGSVLMSSGLTSTWQCWLIVQIIGATQSFQYLPLIPVCQYGYYHWGKNM